MARKKKKATQASVKASSKSRIKTKAYIPKPMPLKFLAGSLVLFIVIAFVLYGASLKFGFVLDDKIVLTENSYTKKGLSGIGALFTTDSFQGYFGEQKEILQGGRYRPLSLVSFAIEYELFGLSAFTYHFNNILLYGLSVFLAFLCLRRLFKEEGTDIKSIVFSVSFVACLLFIFHPLHTEAVANVKGRDEIMSFLFSILALLFSLKYCDGKKRLDLIWANLFLLLGLFSKENTITFLAIIPAGLLLFRNVQVKTVAVVGGSLLLTVVAYLIIRVQALGYLFIDNPSSDIMNNPFVGMGIIEKYATILYTLLVYLKLFIIPIQLTHDYYPFHIPTMNAGDWQVWLSVLVYTAMVGAIVRYWRSARWVSFSLLFYLAALSIVSNVVINVGTTMNERFVFTAILGLCILAAGLLMRSGQVLSFMKHPMARAGLLAIVLGLYGFKTIDRVPAWETELSLNQAAIKVSKNSARANSFMATAYFNRYKETSDREEKRRLIEAARPYAEKAVALYPDYHNANLMMAGISAEEYKYDGDIRKLLNAFQDIARRRPDVDYLTTYLKYLNGKSNHVEPLMDFYIETGDILLNEEQRYDWAVHYLLLGENLEPGNPQIRQRLVRGYQLLGRNDLAERYM